MIGSYLLFPGIVTMVMGVLADQIASAAHLVMGEADEGIPAVLIRGLSWDAADRPAA